MFSLITATLAGRNMWLFLTFQNKFLFRRKVIIIIIIIINHISVMELGHLLTRSGLTYPEVSSKVYHDSFCQLGSSISLPWVIYFEDILFTCCIQLLLYSSNLSKISVIFNSFAICAFVCNLSKCIHLQLILLLQLLTIIIIIIIIIININGKWIYTQ